MSERSRARRSPSRRTVEDPDRGEIPRVVHEELGRLPERLRAPLVLCYLEGMTHELAARQLRCPVGTVRSRLARARALLQERIARRGLSTSAAALAASLESTSRAAASPPQIPRSLIAVATQFASGSASIGGGMGVSASVAVLLEGVLIVMRVKKLASLAAGRRGRGSPGRCGRHVGVPCGRTDRRPLRPAPPGRRRAAHRAGWEAHRAAREPTGVRRSPIIVRSSRPITSATSSRPKPSPKFARDPSEGRSQGSVPRPADGSGYVTPRRPDHFNGGPGVMGDSGRSGEDDITSDVSLTAPEVGKPYSRLPDGSITPFYLSISLIIRRTPEVHEEVANLLRGLRRLAEARGNPGVNLEEEEQKLVPGQRSSRPPTVAASPER